ncbi:MAG: hypothetical protein JSV39_02550 [Candidatus Aenigmatarchaeota archaeon]|nr:MAG: hypothetical protein JSV39_02550 [Candidatus Aenigmarchaeota archaeon]
MVGSLDCSCSDFSIIEMLKIDGVGIVDRKFYIGSTQNAYGEAYKSYGEALKGRYGFKAFHITPEELKIILTGLILEEKKVNEVERNKDKISYTSHLIRELRGKLATVETESLLSSIYPLDKECEELIKKYSELDLKRRLEDCSWGMNNKELILHSENTSRTSTIDDRPLLKNSPYYTPVILNILLDTHITTMSKPTSGTKIKKPSD